MQIGNMTAFYPTTLQVATVRFVIAYILNSQFAEHMYSFSRIFRRECRVFQGDALPRQRRGTIMTG
jgi:hypothetical protein